MYPTQWREVDRCSWEVSLRCPNCEWATTDVFDQETVERFDEELDRGTDSLVDDLKRLVAANMEDEIERFSQRPHQRPHPPRGLLAGVPATPQPSPHTTPERNRRPPIWPAVSFPAYEYLATMPSATSSSCSRSGRSTCARQRLLRLGDQPSGSAPGSGRGRPEAAIRSQASSAASRDDSERRSSAAQLRVALASNDQGQRDGAVEQVGAALPCRSAPAVR